VSQWSVSMADFQEVQRDLRILAWQIEKWGSTTGFRKLDMTVLAEIQLIATLQTIAHGGEVTDKELCDVLLHIADHLEE
jgi:hypothetical protein